MRKQAEEVQWDKGIATGRASRKQHRTNEGKRIRRQGLVQRIRHAYLDTPRHPKDVTRGRNLMRIPEQERTGN